MLSDLPALKVFLRVGSTDTSQDALLAQLLAAADRAVKLFVKRDLETANYTEYRDGPGVAELALRQRPVRAYTLTGTLANGSAVVTGLPSTANLLAGMAVVAQNSPTGLPSGATVLSVDSASQVTLTAAATVSGAQPLAFGLAVWLDAGGFSGDGVGAFPAGTQLVLGKDFALIRDDPSGSGLSRSGLLRRLGGGPAGGVLDWPWGWRKGTLTARLAPAWPAGYGNCKISYCAGLGAGAPVGGTLPSGTTLPADLTYCCNAVAAFIRASVPAGVPLQAEQAARQAAAILNGPTTPDPEVGTVRAALRSYREASF